MAIELQPCDALILHVLLHQYVTPSASKLHRRPMQYHYCQISNVWSDVAVRRRVLHVADDGYGGRTIPRERLPPGRYIYRSRLERPIVPIKMADQARWTSR